MLSYYHLAEPFVMESGQSIPLSIAYATYGTLKDDKSNVVWVCHALTASAQVTDWWRGLVGEGCAINPEEHFIVCANIVGSCYGTTGPLSLKEETNQSFLRDFPFITIRDMVAAHIRLRKHLGIDQIRLLAGGSMGGYQVLEWALIEPEVPQQLLLLSTSAAESAWGIAIHEAQRMAIEADHTWRESRHDGGSEGLKAARAIGMLTYRGYALFAKQQAEEDNEKLDGFRAASYQNYQGVKLAQRFNAYSYWTLTKAMDTHNVARGRNCSIQEALRMIEIPSLIIGISSDILCPMPEQQMLAGNMQNATLVEIDSPYGHDGFLVESKLIGECLRQWWKTAQ